MSVTHHVRVSQSCTACGVCVEICPTDVLRMADGMAVPVYEADCQACFLCVIDCPYQAIAVMVELGTDERSFLADVNGAAYDSSDAVLGEEERAVPFEGQWIQ